ncbi:hypothetical protein DSM104443_04236 [Usitatibacter rugosus]|uniref:NAD-dependent epimerase/dehydratase domain-containing protein n=1 Tax=Usitatibacter rugosus TaxID=2732067 RepID=A0A6M4H0W8_9PROT|nr:NAD-dependent epimerase/dehydratase family protein [Usitatibacter rugosus]QJR13141.1 hypothetical protein DSM104443_04236 [Usitatibacter rugosus]
MASTDRWIVTGAAGFVGTGLAALARATVQPLSLAPDDWRARIAAVDFRSTVVFHLAARVHGRESDEAQWMRDNAEKTAELARAAASGGARRFVFLSTIKVNGEETLGQPFRATDAPGPSDAYARSKHEGERALAIAASPGLEYVVVRSPLVIGPAAPANLAALVRLADSAWPLPFGAIRNRRTFIARDDLVSLLVRCAESPRAVGRTFLAGDPDAVSTPRLFNVVRSALARPARMFGMPAGALEAAASLAGQGDRMRRLTRSLEVDCRDAMETLEWAPRRPMDEALREMARSAKGAA